MILAATRDELCSRRKGKTTRYYARGHCAHGTPDDKLYQDYRVVEDTLGETMLILVVAKGYVSRLLRNDNISVY